VTRLVQENSRLAAENLSLQAQLAEIASALGRAQRSGAQPLSARRGGDDASPKRPRRKVTDPEVLDRRRQALAKARAVRAEKLAAARQPDVNGVAQEAPVAVLAEA
jgi:hypothetical protein